MDITLEPSTTNSRIVAAYRARTPGSESLHRQAQALLPSGIAHDARYLDPYSLYIDRAAGPHKWDVDGHRYVDFFGGHGALILGHSHPVVTQAVGNALAKGTQFGANHPAELDWVRAIQRLVPSAERFGRVLAERRKRGNPLTRLVLRLTGMEAKLNQYAAGERFIGAIEAEGGPRVVDTCWQEAANLPSLEEIRTPSLWLHRMGLQVA